MVGSSASTLPYSTALSRIQVTVVRSGDFKNTLMTLGAFKMNWVPNDDTNRLNHIRCMLLVLYYNIKLLYTVF